LLAGQVRFRRRNGDGEGGAAGGSKILFKRLHDPACGKNNRITEVLSKFAVKDPDTHEVYKNFYILKAH
jgi:hypothetical protein